MELMHILYLNFIVNLTLLRECGHKVRSTAEQTVNWLFIQGIRRDSRTGIRQCEFKFNTHVFQGNERHLRAYREDITIGPLMGSALKKYKSPCKICEDNNWLFL